MARDKLFLIAPDFTDPVRSEGFFVCPHCNQLEGLLASFPVLATKLDIERVPFPRPRQNVIAAIGEANQSLPVLVLGDAAPPPDDAETAGNKRFVTSTKRIIELLPERHGFPQLHG
jgi:hypothetical protein